MSDEQGDGFVTAEGFARAENISPQTVVKAIKGGIIEATTSERGYYLFRRDAVPAEWLASVKARRDLRWGGQKNGQRAAKASVADSVMADTLVFLREQLTAKDEVIDRLLRLLETRENP